MKKVLGTAMYSPKMEIISMLGCLKTFGWLGTVAGSTSNLAEMRYGPNYSEGDFGVGKKLLHQV